MIEEIKHRVGSWSIELAESTPRAIIDIVKQPWSYLFVTPVHAVDSSMSLNTLMNLAHYAGVTISQEGAGLRQVSGLGAFALLGTPDGTGWTGHFLGLPIADGSDITKHLDDTGGISAPIPITGGRNGIVQGTTTSASITTEAIPLQVGKTWFDLMVEIAARYDCWFKLTMPASGSDEFSYEASNVESDIFRTDPEVVFWEGPTSHEPGPLAAVNAEIGVKRSVDRWASSYVMWGRVSGVGLWTPSNIYKDITGADLTLSHAEFCEGVGSTARAYWLNQHFEYPAYEVTVTAELYAPRRYIEPGDTVGVWHPSEGVHDDLPWATEQTIRGQTIGPREFRVESMTWPFLPGYGAYNYYDDGSAATLTDITDYVVPEDSPTTFEVGRVPRRLTWTPPTNLRSGIS